MATYEVTDVRPEIVDQNRGVPRHVKTLENVPDDWTVQMVLDRHGIGDHLRMSRVDNGRLILVQNGRTHRS